MVLRYLWGEAGLVMRELPDLPECDLDTDGAPVRQGDIIRFLDPGEDVWRQLGIVVTADCDIVQQKHRGLLTYVPILSVRDYLTLSYLPRAIRKSMKGLKDRCLKLIRTIQADRRPESPEPIPEETALAWLERSGPAGVLQGLAVEPAENAYSDYHALLLRLEATRAAITGGSFDEQARTLISLRAEQSKNASKAADKLAADIERHLAQLPGDALFIGTVEDNRASGHVAYLRILREITEPEIAIRPSQLSDAETTAQRVARLRAPYRYRLTQQLGEVFAAIGLPKPYEENRSAIALALLDNHKDELTS